MDLQVLASPSAAGPQPAVTCYLRAMSGTVCETRRLRLREFARDLSDLEALNAIQSNADHMRHYPHPFSLDESRAWIEKRFEQYDTLGFSLWAVEDHETGEFLGNVGPTPLSVDGADEIELGWSIAPWRAREGIATEAGLACRERCFGALDLTYLVSLVRPENTPSVGVAEKLGMTVWKETSHAGLRHFVFRVDRPS